MLLASLGGLAEYYRGAGFARLVLLALGAYGLALSVLTGGGFIVVIAAVFTIAGLLLSIRGLFTPGILSYYIAFTSLTLYQPSILVVSGLAAASLVYAYAGSPSIGRTPIAIITLKSLPFALYAGLFASILYEYGLRARFLPRLSKEVFSGSGGYILIMVTVIFFYSLLALWTFLPGRSIPRVSGVAGWLRRNRTVGLEALSYSLILLASKANVLSLFAIVLGAAAYVWVRALGYGRHASFLGFLVVYALTLHALGIMDDINSYLSKTP